MQQAANAKEQSEQASIQEQIQLAVLAAMTVGNGDIDIETLQTELSKIDGYSGTVASVPAMIEINGESYSIAADGTVGVSGTWAYVKDSDEKITGVTNGVITLGIGDYINYDATDTESGEEVTATSSAGSPSSSTSYYTASEQTLSEGNGYADQTFSSASDEGRESTTTGTTGGWRVLGVNEDRRNINNISKCSPIY